MKKDRSQDHAPDLDNPEAGQATRPGSDPPPVPPKQDPPAPPKQDPPAPAKSTRFDPSRFRLSQDFTAETGVVESVSSIAVRKPKRQEWFRAFDGPGWPFPTRILESQEDKDTIYLVANRLWSVLGDELKEKLLFLCLSRSGEVFLWPIRLVDPFGKPDYWSLTAREAAETAKTRWTRNTSDMNRGRYRVYTSGVDLAPVQWPSLSPEEIIELAFGDRMIEDIDHPILRRLRGEL
jgi:hypothetical protein